MGKNILKKVKTSIIAVITGLSCTIVPNTFDVQAAVEGGTDIWLKLEKKTIDIDDIPDNGIVNLDVSIENNTQIDFIGFIIEKDSRLRYKEYSIMQSANDKVAGSSYMSTDNDNIMLSTVFFDECPYEDNGTFVRLQLVLPDKQDVRVGDRYRINILSSYDNVRPSVGVLVPEAKILEGSEYFGGFEGGEIVITDDNPEPVQNDQVPPTNSEQQPSPPEQQQNNEQPEPENENNNNSTTVQTKVESITLPVTTVNQTTVATTTSLTAAKGKKTATVSTVSVTTAEETESTTETDITDRVTTESEKNSEDSENSKSKLIICVAVIMAVLAFVSAVAIKNIKRRKKDE